MIFKPKDRDKQTGDEFRFKHRFVTRAAVIKWLLEAALSAKLGPAKGE